VKAIPGLQVAVDGPSGSGKGTVSSMLAALLDLPVYDTGLLYRFVAGITHERKVDVDDEKAIVTMMDQVMNCIEWNADGLSMPGMSPGSEIRSEETGSLASRIAKYPEVRNRLMGLQRSVAVGGCIMDGRDIGTMILPEAKAKFFLTASIRERARRRWRQLQDGDPQISLEDVVSDLMLRDNRDRKRKHAPLHKAGDAVLIDTTTLRQDEVVDRMIAIMQRRGLILG